MGFKTGMFKYFNELDEDCSGFLEPDEITSKLQTFEKAILKVTV